MDSTINGNQEVERPSILLDAPASIDWELLQMLEDIHREQWESLSPASEAKVKEYHLEVAQWAREREAPMNHTWESELKYYETFRALGKDAILDYDDYESMMRSGLRMAYMEKFDRGGAFVDANGLRYDSLILFMKSEASQELAEYMEFTLEQLTSAETSSEPQHPANTT